MEALTVISRCGDGSCCCIPQRSMIALISIISLIACILDMITTSSGPTQYPENLTLLCVQVDCAKQLLITLFQMANLLLLLASIVESAILVQLYVWYTLAFVVLGLIVNIVDFLFKYQLEGTSCLIGFITEVCFLFAPCSSVYSVKLFSEVGGYEDKQNRLLPLNSEKLVFICHNLPLLQ